MIKYNLLLLHDGESQKEPRELVISYRLIMFIFMNPNVLWYLHCSEPLDIILW